MSAPETPLTQNLTASGAAADLDAYEAAGGYQGLRRALGSMTPDEVTETVKAANLRGRGGAGFPAGLKWASMPEPDDPRRPRYLVVNADEMEPGAFKDRVLMEGDPHQLLEGMILAAYAIDADIAFILIRAEYVAAARRLQRAIDEAAARGYIGGDILGSGKALEVHVHRSAGRYLCGESSAILNALEGRRVIPRPKPPRGPQAGLWGRPTVVNNVETLCNVPHIVVNGADWYLGLSRAPEGKHGKDGGTKLFAASGRVKRPGLWELPMGTTIGEILEEHAGGLRDGLGLQGLQPGGGSTGFLTEAHLDLPMDFDSVQAAGSRIGTGTMIVLDDASCPVAMLQNLERFFARESCGWCTPCREGLPWTARTLGELEAGRGTRDDIERLQWHARHLDMPYTFCAHAPGAMMPLKSALHYFRDAFERHVEDGCCPWHG